MTTDVLAAVFERIRLICRLRDLGMLNAAAYLEVLEELRSLLASLICTTPSDRR